MTTVKHRAGTRLLIVDEDQDLREVWAYALQQRGYQVLTTRNGAAASEKWQAAQPDVVLLDSGWPGRDGLDLLHQMRQSETTPVIAATAEHDEEHQAECLRLGADDVLVKPFRL